MKKTDIIKKIESQGTYCKVKINKHGEITGMLTDENYRYDSNLNKGGRRFVGYANEQQTMSRYDLD